MDNADVRNLILSQAVEKLPNSSKCHSERGAESCIFNQMRCFVWLRMMKRAVFQ